MKNSNKSYTIKVVGEKKFFCEKFWLGFMFSFIVLLVLCGPMILFSTMSGFVAPNPVVSGEIEFDFIMKQRLDDRVLLPYTMGQFNKTS